MTVYIAVMASSLALYMGMWCALPLWLVLWRGAVVDGSPLLVWIGDAAAGEVIKHTFGVGVELVVLIFPICRRVV